MISNFSRHIRDSWNWKVLPVRKCQSREPNLSGIITFVKVKHVTKTRRKREGRNHYLGSCYQYKQIEVEKRRKLLIKNKLCFGCYVSINKDHYGSNFPKRRNSNICRENHPIGLHRYKPKNTELGTRSNNNTPSDNGRKSSEG